MIKKFICTALIFSNCVAFAEPMVPEDVQTDIESAVSKMADAAISGNLAELIDWTTEQDHNRLDSDEYATEANNLERDAESFSEYLEDDLMVDVNADFSEENLPVTVTSYDELNHIAQVRLGTGADSINLKMVNQGTLGDAWRVDVSDNLSRAALVNSLSSMMKSPGTAFGNMADTSARAQYKPEADKDAAEQSQKKISVEKIAIRALKSFSQ